MQTKSSITFTNTVSALQATVSDAVTVLSYYDKHPDDYLFYTRKHGLSDKWSHCIVATALNIKNHLKYITSRGNSRLYPKNSKKLLPAAPASTVELEDVNVIWKRLDQLDDQAWNKIRKSIDYFFQRSLLQHSFIAFSDQHEADEFIALMSNIIGPRSR